MPMATPEAQREYMRKWVAKRRAAFFSGKVCEKCGGIDRLELDHIDPSAKISHNIWSWSEERRSAEIAKCQILCHECHLDKTKAELNRPLIHGTDSTGYKRGCQCDDCREAHRVGAREYRAARKLILDSENVPGTVSP